MSALQGCPPYRDVCLTRVSALQGCPPSGVSVFQGYPLPGVSALSIGPQRERAMPQQCTRAQRASNERTQSANSSGVGTKRKKLSHCYILRQDTTPQYFWGKVHCWKNVNKMLEMLNIFASVLIFFFLFLFISMHRWRFKKIKSFTFANSEPRENKDFILRAGYYFFTYFLWREKSRRDEWITSHVPNPLRLFDFLYFHSYQPARARI